MRMNWPLLLKRLLIAAAIGAGAEMAYMQFLTMAASYTSQIGVQDLRVQVGALQRQLTALQNSMATDAYMARLQPGQEPHILEHDGVKFYYPPRTNGEDGCHGHYIPIDDLGTHYACAKRHLLD